MKDIKELLFVLKKEYPKTATALRHENPFQLLIATILSAQCTDERVNMVTPVLFRKYPTPERLGKGDLNDIESIIHSTGFYKSKARSIKETSRILAEKFSSKVPRTMNELLSLKGVARKTANVVLGNGYGIAEGIVVDTHVKRVSFRLGLTKNTSPAKVEKDLMKIIPEKDWIWFSNALILHGRKYCAWRNPLCNKCPAEKMCPKQGL